MTERVTLPDPNVTFAKCSRCGADLKIDPHWYSKLVQIVQTLNGLL